MKTLIIYSGQARTFDQVWRNHRWYLWRRYPGAAVCASVSDDEDAEKMEILNQHFPVCYVEKCLQQVTTINRPTTVERDLAAGYNRSATEDAIFRQLWHLKRAWTCATSVFGIDFDQVIRVRCDTRFLRLEPIYNPASDAAHTPWWSRWGGVNDRFAILGALAAGHYFETYDKLLGLFDAGAPTHPETLVRASLELGRVKLHDNLSCEFVTVRKNGSIIACDPTLIDQADYARHPR